MAAGILPTPGTEHGPCEGGCEHTDCARTREWAAIACAHCQEPIGYGIRFYRTDTRDGAPVLAHATCEEERAS